MSVSTESILNQFRSEFLSRPNAAVSSAATAPARPVANSTAMDITASEDYQRVEQIRDYYGTGERHNPYFMPRSGTMSSALQVEGTEYICFSGYNYLGLSNDARVIGAAQDALGRYGTHAGAARMVGGEMELHQELEQGLCDAFGFEDCVTSVGGYAVNVTTLGYLLSAKDLLISDEYMHNSGVMGGVMAHARRMSFPHNDLEALERLLKTHRGKYERAIILVEGAYSMDGDLADVPKLLELKRKYNAWLMIDEAHSLGVVGDTGKGVCEHFGVDPRDVDLIMGTLSKSFASCGGFIGGSQAMIDTLRHFAPGMLLYSTGLPPASAAAALAAIEVMGEEPERVTRLHSNVRRFVELATERGLDVGDSGASAVVPVLLGDTELALHTMSKLLEEGIIAHAVMYPVVPHNEARLRFFLTAEHTEAQFVKTLDLLASILRNSASTQ
ncbi:MAG: aminotransferase class I/II-fold pyridoxal phosphate-dependent enzyme [Pseudomonadota bacterium]